jgi:hypothetical protein
MTPASMRGDIDATRKEYDALIERGILAPEDRVELIDGFLVVAEPQSAYHYTRPR